MGPAHGAPSDHDVVSALVGSLPSSFRVGSPLAQQVIAEDLAACSSDEDDDIAVDGTGHDLEHEPGHTMYRRPSGVAYGASRPVFNIAPVAEPTLSELERKQSRRRKGGQKTKRKPQERKGKRR